MVDLLDINIFVETDADIWFGFFSSNNPQVIFIKYEMDGRVCCLYETLPKWSYYEAVWSYMKHSIFFHVWMRITTTLSFWSGSINYFSMLHFILFIWLCYLSVLNYFDFRMFVSVSVLFYFSRFRAICLIFSFVLLTFLHNFLCSFFCFYVCYFSCLVCTYVCLCACMCLCMLVCICVCSCAFSWLWVCDNLCSCSFE